jgi:type I restriction enzyme S subunit
MSKGTTKDTRRKLPDGWRLVRLQELILDARAGFACGQRDPEGVIQLRMNNVGTRGNLIWDDVLRVPADESTIREYRLLPGDVVFNNTNSTELVGKSALFESYDEPVVYSNHFTRLRTNLDALSPGFLAAWLNHQWLRGVFASICNRWIGQSAVKSDKLLNIEVPLPPLEEQRRIAAVLHEQMAAVEKARAAAQARLEAVKAILVSLLRQVFPQPGQPLPAGWRWVRLGDHSIKVGSGITPRGGQASYHSTGIPLIRSQNVDYNLFLAEGLAFISREQDEAMEGSRVQEGDVLLNITGASIGRVCVVPEKICPANVNQHVSILRFGGDVQPAFLSYYLSTPGFQKFILEAQAGATRQALTKALIENFQIPFTSLAEQKHVAGLLREQMAAVEKARQAAEEELQTINALPAALLRRAFNGEI